MKKSSLNIKPTSPIVDSTFTTIENASNIALSGDSTWWCNSFMLMVLTFFFSSLDGFSLYPIFFEMYTQSELLMWITTIGIALTLNFLPILAARFLLDYKYGHKQSLALFYMILVIYAILYIGLGYLRISTRDLVFDTITNYISSSSNLVAMQSIKDTASAFSMVLFLCFLNLATSVIAFLLAYRSEDPIKLKIIATNKAIAKLTKNIAALASTREELESFDYNNALGEEQLKYAIHLDSIRNHASDMMVTYRTMLAKACKNPNKTTEITKNAKKLFKNTDISNISPED